MNHAVKLCQSALAVLGLLFGVASQATSLSELPLKTSILAKPNVIFGLDDSGSMDAEVMIDGNEQGWFYGDYSTSYTALYPGGRPATGSSSRNQPMFYLFPNGTGTGNKVYADPAVSRGYAIPPTPELAWTRSPSYNSVYYDTRRSYEPWAPAYIGGATRTYGNANASSPLSHPALGSTTVAITSNLFATHTEWRFTFTPGMTIPSGVSDLNCDSNTPGSVGSGGFLVTTSQNRCKAAVSYFPATFWHRESCTVNGSSCVAAWDGQTLKRYEIKSGNSFPSGRSYADELQNFANWFSYYRKRRLMLAASMGDVLENLSGLRLGVVKFNARAAPTMYDADAGSAANNRLAVSGIFYTAEGNQSTPTHATMGYIYNEFNTNTGVIQYACQRNASFIITDGFSNDAATAAPTYSQSTYGSGAPYQSIASASLADKALAHYTLPLRSVTSPLATGRVPPGRTGGANPDTNTNLHLTTYALTLGMKGTLWPPTADPFVTAPAWPTPVADTATMIDDLWHATINGRGKMYLATDSTGTAAGIAAGLSDILDQVGAQASLAVSSINLDRGDAKAYLGTYNPAGWTGNLTANAISATTAEVSTTVTWSADALLRARDWTTRVIATHNGSAGVAFSAAAVGATVNPGAVWGSNAAVIDYLRGSRAGEGSSFRVRSSLIGAVINAEPVISRDDKLVYLASGEGMLHAFDTETGAEHWAYVPPQVLANLGQVAGRDYAFRSKLDATPALGKLAGSGKRLLVGALGGAARGYYALDVSSPRGMTETQLAAAAVWHFPATGDGANLAKMGYSYGKPVIAKTATQGDVVLVTSGYDNAETIGDGKGRMWMLNAASGTVLREFVTSDGSTGAEAGLSHVSAYRETDGTVRHVYGGDLLGNLWHFDLDTGSTVKLAVLKDAAGNLQPVTAAPELVTVADKRIVMVGTGRLLDISDFGSTRTQSFYVIADGAVLSNARSGLVAQTYTRGASPELGGGTVSWASDRGWYFDLPVGEQANTSPSVAYGTVGFTTNKNGGSDCEQSAYMYLVDIKTGQKSAITDFASAQISSTANASRLVALRIANGQLVGTSHTSDNGVFRRVLGTRLPIQPAKNAWREIRR